MFGPSFHATVKTGARYRIAHPFASGGMITQKELAEAAGHVVAWKTDEHGTRYWAPDNETWRIGNVGLRRIEALKVRYSRFRHYMRETRHRWYVLEGSKSFYMDNSVEAIEVSRLTGEHRRVTLVAPHGDVC